METGPRRETRRERRKEARRGEVEFPLESHECKAQGGRQATPPLREGGGAAMDGMFMHGRRKTARAVTGGVLRLAVAASVTPHRQRTNRDFCGWTKWTHAATAPRNTPPAALSICSEGTIPLAILPPGGTPLSEGGAGLRAHHSPNISPQSPGADLVFCMVGLGGRGRPPGGPSWAILSHGPPGGRALPEGATDKKPHQSLPSSGAAGSRASGSRVVVVQKVLRGGGILLRSPWRG